MMYSPRHVLVRSASFRWLKLLVLHRTSLSDVFLFSLVGGWKAFLFLSFCFFIAGLLLPG